MVLQFKFKYISSDKTLAKFLDYTARQFDCEYKILKDLDFVYIFIKADDEIIEEFSEALSYYLPMSLYYYDLQIDVVEQFPFIDSVSLEQDKLISFCPSCLKQVENENSSNYYNAFKSCEICDGFENGSFIFEGVQVESNIELFENLASLINDGQKIKIKTLSGDFVFSKLNDLNTSTNLLVTNLRNISSLVVENKTDIVALASIEKPSVDFKINEIYKIKNNVLKSDINIRYANDLTLFLLSLQLQKYNIDFLNIEDEKTEFNYFLDVKENIKREKFLDIPKVKCYENKKIFIESQSYSKNLDLLYNKFQEKNKSHFMTVLAENNLFEKSILNFYISTKNDDGLSFYSTKFDGLIDIVKPFDLPKSVEEIFVLIEKTEGGKRLVSNYKKKFLDDYTKAINTDISIYHKNSFYNYWQIVRVVLNFKNDILENAKRCLLEKGPRIDYKLIDNEKLHNREFDYIKLIKSAISFKIAGVEEETISLGYIESLAHFIANEVDTINSMYEVDGVSLCGDMFTYDIFTTLVEKSITKNFTLYYNREFVIQK